MVDVKLNSSESFLEFRNFSLYFSGNCILNQINFSLNEKKLMALVGPRDSGKSLLLQSINRLYIENPSLKEDGDIYLKGQSLFRSNLDLLKHRRKIGMVFPEPSLLPNMSIFENLALGLRLKGARSEALIHEKVLDSLQFLGIQDEVLPLIYQYPDRLSQGIRQKLVVARALVLKPKLLLLDEPTTYMSSHETQDFESMLRRIHGKLTMVFSTRRRSQAARFSDRTAFLLEGEMVEVGKTSDLFMNPQDSRTEEYLTGRFGL